MYEFGQSCLGQAPRHSGPLNSVGPQGRLPAGYPVGMGQVLPDLGSTGPLGAGVPPPALWDNAPPLAVGLRVGAPPPLAYAARQAGPGWPPLQLAPAAGSFYNPAATAAYGLAYGSLAASPPFVALG